MPVAAYMSKVWKHWVLSRSKRAIITERRAPSPQSFTTNAIHLSRFESHRHRCTPRISVTRDVTRNITTKEPTTSKKIFIPSKEQQAIVDLCRTHNVVVSARPGSGKTATAEAIVAANPGCPVAIITYSKRLQLDTSRRMGAYPCSDVLTFHGLAGKLFSTVAFNDSLLQSLRGEGSVPVWNGKPYEIVILDEMQDCTDDLFWLTYVFMSAVTRANDGKVPRIVALGDERQAINGFRGANSRYLTLASSAFGNLSPYPWTSLTLRESFRLSYQNSAFVNNVFLSNEQYLVGSRDGPKPLYLHGNIFNAERLSLQLLPLIRKYGYARTAILAPSVRNNVPLSKLANHLCRVHGVPIAVLGSDEMPLHDKVLWDKLCVSSYHQFKGNERDLVIVFGVDANYFTFHAKDLPDDTCPNTTFVALTRALEQVVLVHNNGTDLMAFANVDELCKTADLVNFDSKDVTLKTASPGRPLKRGLCLPPRACASELTRHVLDESKTGICSRHLDIIKALPPLPEDQHISPPSIVLTDSVKKHHESVCDLNGIAIMAAFEYDLLGTLTTLGISKKSKVQLPSCTEARAIWLCRQACKYDASVSGYVCRSVQMKNNPFNWLGPHLNAARRRLHSQFAGTSVLRFEVPLQEAEFRVAGRSGDEDQTTGLYGRADVIESSPGSSIAASTTGRKKKRMNAEITETNDVTIWEIKFVAQLSLEHVIQACVYAYLLCREHKRAIPPKIVLFNVRDGEKWKIVPRDGVDSLQAVVEETLIAKYSTKDSTSEDEFLARCKNTVAEVERSFGCTR